MQTRPIILFLLVFFPLQIFGQDTIPVPQTENEIEIAVDTLIPQDSPKELHLFEPVTSSIDTTQKINFWTITPQTGEMIPAIPDTILTDYFNRTNVEGMGVSVAYLGNLGLPMESRVFFEREDRSEFMFFDPFWAYAKRPDKFQFINTKVPYTNVSYQTAGSRQSKEERLQALLTVNLGKKLNLGFEVDYLYARGYYNSQAAKHTDWVFFGNYLSDRHRLHLFINPSTYANAENGGLDNDDWISHPDLMDTRPTQSQDYGTKFGNTWNYNKGQRYFLNYRYNLGFERDSTFIPVSSIIYTFDLTKKSHRFYSLDTTRVNTFYNDADFLNPLRNNKLTDDSTSYSSLKNTFALSLREGFSNWAKFDLTAFITHEIRNFTLMDTTIVNPQDSILTFKSRNERYSSAYIGGELAKRTGKILRYNAYGSFGILGVNQYDVNISGNIETRIPFLKDTASVVAKAYFKNLSPAFYENNYISRYFKWDNDFKKIRKTYLGGEINVPQTKTKLGIGVENIENYIYFDKDGYPKQYSNNIQILAATLQQNIRLGALNWNNQVVYQRSGE
ncbi:MAG: putative porin, partial [Candidatus Symbiothrix sp.]|nr:putative porin [Candidatus Symbiothrix sp.]